MKNNKIKIVVDTNVFINSIIFPNKNIEDTLILDKLISLINLNNVELVFSQETIGELIYVIKNHVKKNISKDKQLNCMENILELFFYSYSVNTEYTKAPCCQDVHDNMFLKCAVQGKAKYLITNDSRSGMNKVIGLNCSVLSSKQFNDLYDTADEFIASTLDNDK